MRLLPATLPPYCHQPDGILWNAFKRGDKEAFATLYHRYFIILIQSSLRISGDKDMIKDCVHDLFVEMWKNKMNLSIPQSVKAYLVSSMHRKIIRQQKKNRLQNALKEFEETPDSDSGNSIEKKIIADDARQEQQNNIYKALSALTKRQKEAVYLKFYANLSYPEIAKKMAISTDSIYNLVSKAIDNLQVELVKTSFPKFS